ncbi:3-oxoadipate enol-lactonase [Xenophilus aerolatus]|nr:3-oxoadipate enol-lactonase [Xenophilus aerolatus]
MSGSRGAERVKVHDIDVAYRYDGPAGAPVVLLAHGLMTSHGIWDGLVAQLQSEWRLLRYDLRGHGGSGGTTEPYTMAQLARDAIGLLDKLEVPRVHFIGSSLGGMIGQQLGALFPARVATLTLANTSANQGAAAAWQQRIETARQHGLVPLIDATLKRWFTDSAFSSEPKLIERMTALALQTSVQGFVGCAAIVRDLAQRDVLERIGMPTLIIAGQYDEATPQVDSEVLRDGIAGAELITLPAAHQSAAECPREFAEAWRRFLRCPSERPLGGPFA